MARMVYGFHVSPEHVDDIRKTAEDVRAALADFTRSRADLGLTELDVWLQSTPEGPLVIVGLAGDLDDYFGRIRLETGLDAWFREKISQWVGSEAEVETLYQYPQSEELFVWRSEP